MLILTLYPFMDANSHVAVCSLEESIGERIVNFGVMVVEVGLEMG